MINRCFHLTDYPPPPVNRHKKKRALPTFQSLPAKILQEVYRNRTITDQIHRSRSGNGAGNEARTRDPKLGKLVLYQLSYTRTSYNSGII